MDWNDCFCFRRTSASVVTVLIFCLFVLSLLIVSKGAWKGGNDPATYQWAPCLISGITCVCRIIELDAELTEESKTCGAGVHEILLGWKSDEGLPTSGIISRLKMFKSDFILSLLPGEAFGRWLQANGRGHGVGAFSHRMHLACCSNEGLVADSEGNQTRGNLSDDVIHAKMHNMMHQLTDIPWFAVL